MAVPSVFNVIGFLGFHNFPLPFSEPIGLGVAMSALECFEEKVSSLWCRRESRYDVLQDFSSAHLGMLRPSAVGKRSGSGYEADYMPDIRRYVSSRADCRKAAIGMQLSTQCSADLEALVNSSTSPYNRKRCRESMETEETPVPGTAAAVAAAVAATEVIEGASLQLASNYCTMSAMKCKRICTTSHRHMYNTLLEKLDRYIEHMEAEYPDIADIADDGIKLPLNSTSAIASDATSTQATQERHEAFVEFQLIQRLHRNIRGTSNLLAQ